jgi:Uma2 family endonuclease
VLPRSWGKIPPDLAVEVVSPNDSADELEEKLDEYQKVAVPHVWVVNLKSRTVMVYRADGSVCRLRESD